jgi:hypothetical protein
VKTLPSRLNAVYARRAALLEEKAERAKVRRARALKLGNLREAEGARQTAEEAYDSARRLRAKIVK